MALERPVELLNILATYDGEVGQEKSLALERPVSCTCKL